MGAGAGAAAGSPVLVLGEEGEVVDEGEVGVWGEGPVAGEEGVHGGCLLGVSLFFEEGIVRCIELLLVRLVLEAVE